MKRLNKHTISIILMCSSITLLLVFQFFWLRKVYEEQRTWLQKEADNLFRTTLAELQDTLFQRNINHSIIASEKGAADLFPVMQNGARFKADTFVYFSDKETHIRVPAPATAPQIPVINIDSLKSTSTFTVTRKDNTNALPRKRSDRMFRIASAFPISPDSIRSMQVNKIMQRVILNVQSTDGKEIVIRFNNDSLSTDSVRLAFSRKLKDAQMPTQFSVRKIQISDWEAPVNQLVVGPMPTGMPPRDFFAGTLMHYNGYLFQKIVPQLLFSLFLTGITALAFLLIYRNLRQQERLTALKNDFISNVTHELKTPIATVSVAIEALSNFNALQNPQLTQEYLNISKNELNRLTILVDKVLKMSIFEQKEPELQLEYVNVKELVTQITASMRLQFEKYHAEVNVDANGEDFMIQGDRLHLTSVIYNLVDNALKYSPEDPKIDITLAQQNGHLHVMVQDNGIGIAPEYKNRVFEKFFRVPTGDVHNVKGYGLGLNYVASVVQKHGGKIEVESAPGKGSTFKVILPRKN
ncbi:MAG: sensor histidine kinase [Saprospiraceae bacterium]